MIWFFIYVLSYTVVAKLTNYDELVMVDALSDTIVAMVTSYDNLVLIVVLSDTDCCSFN